MKKLKSSIDYTDRKEDKDTAAFWKASNYDHSKLEAFLEDHPDVEAYSRDGLGHYLIIENSFFDMGSSGQLSVGAQIYRKFDNYTVCIAHSTNHSGYIWRRVIFLQGGYSDPEYRSPRRLFVMEPVEQKDFPIEVTIEHPWQPRFTNCTYCKKERPCTVQEVVDEKATILTCDLCFRDVHQKIKPS